MTPYTAFKKCLIDGWLTGKVRFCAQMIMQDYGILSTVPSGFPDEFLILKFMRDIKMPPYPQYAVSTYIAAYYPVTNTALFDGRKDALAIFLKENARPSDTTKGLAYERRTENSKWRRTRFISARAGDKKHDWKTVK